MKPPPYLYSHEPLPHPINLVFIIGISWLSSELSEGFVVRRKMQVPHFVRNHKTSELNDSWPQANPLRRPLTIALQPSTSNVPQSKAQRVEPPFLIVFMNRSSSLGQ